MRLYLVSFHNKKSCLVAACDAAEARTTAAYERGVKFDREVRTVSDCTERATGDLTVLSSLKKPAEMFFTVFPNGMRIYHTASNGEFPCPNSFMSQ